MPLVVYALGAYVVGLYAGFSASPLFALAAIGVAFAIGWTRAHTVAPGLVALVTAGIAIARLDTRADDACVKAAERSDSLTVVVADSIGPGGFARGRLADCAAWIAVSASEGSADAGATVVAHGTVLRSQRG